MKFTIRDLFLVTVIVAVCVAWWLDRSRLVNRAARAEGELRMGRFIDEVMVLTNSVAPAPKPPKP
jgi:hypothetical protein